MNYTKHIISLSLVGLLSTSINADSFEKKSRYKEERVQAHEENARAHILARLLGAAAIGGLGIALCKSDNNFLERSGLSVGLGASSIFGALSLLFDQHSAQTLRGMAVTAPVVAVVGTVIASEAVTGQKGLLSKAPFLGELAKNANQKESKEALRALAIVGTYIATQPYLHRFSDWVMGKTSHVYRHVTGS